MSLDASNITWLVVALPLAGFLVCAAFGKRLSRPLVGGLATALVFGSFALSVLLLLSLLRLPEEGRRVVVSLLPGGSTVPWIAVGRFEVSYLALVDPLSVLMCLIVTGVGGLIHLYATGYMAKDRDYPRFFTYFNLFIFFMLVLVLGENLLLMFVGWEGVGLCSYLLISFWYHDMENSKAGNKAFIVNRVGDVGFALGIMLVFATFGTLSFYTANGSGFLDMARQGITANGALTAGLATAIALLLFVGACGKSAQFPLHVWLPDAMAGPTPVSALIHAATMVTAGVVMVARVSPVIIHSPAAMTTIAVVGLFTAVFAATIALTQNDIKKVLAYSTVSQLGYMFLGCGVGAFTAGMFHVTTHAFFKALLFLGAGSVIHALHHEQDMRRMGGLKTRVPTTYRTMLLGWLAICGIPPFAGFWSKDEILGAASGYPNYGLVFYGVGVVTAALTAFYMSRLMWKTFWTDQRYREEELGKHHGADEWDDAEGHGNSEPHGHHEPVQVKESPPSMTVPLIVLAGLSVVGGLIGMPWANLFHHYLEPAVAATTAHHGVPVPLGLLIGTLAAVAGIGYACTRYSKHRDTGDLLTPEQRRTNPLYLGASNLWGVDGLFYQVFVTRGGSIATSLWQQVDRLLIDGAVNLLAGTVGFLSQVLRLAQTGFVRTYALTMMAGVILVVAWVLSALNR